MLTSSVIPQKFTFKISPLTLKKRLLFQMCFKLQNLLGSAVNYKRRGPRQFESFHEIPERRTEIKDN